MKRKDIEIKWSNGNSSIVQCGDDWLKIAFQADFAIPTGCLGGSCGACEIEVNGEIIEKNNWSTTPFGDYNDLYIGSSKEPFIKSKSDESYKK